MAGLEAMPGVKRDNIKPQVDEYTFADGHHLSCSPKAAW